MNTPVEPTDAGTPRSMTYKEAVYLAAHRRREGSNSYAVFDVPLGEWCVKVGASHHDAR